MAYCATTDVQARAGILLDDLTANPTSAELDGMIVDAAAMLDGFMAGGGYAIPVTNPVAVAALHATNTDGALVLALEARFVGTSGDGGAPSPILVGARARWSMAIALLSKGLHPAQLILGQSTGELLAGSFGADDADGYVPAPLDPYRTTPHNTNTEPTIYQGMHL